MALHRFQFRHVVFAVALAACGGDEPSDATSLPDAGSTSDGGGRRDRSIDLPNDAGGAEAGEEDAPLQDGPPAEAGGDDALLDDRGAASDTPVDDTRQDENPIDDNDATPGDDVFDVNFDAADLPPCDDNDGDGFGVGCLRGEDCDDADPFTWPGAPQICDGNDNTCAGTVPADELDADGDDWVVCTGFADWQGDDGGIEGGDDCDDDDDAVFPGTTSCPATAFFEERFERDDGGWSAGGTSPSWQWGAPDGVAIREAGEGEFAWKTNLDGPYGANEQSWLMSPPLDFSDLGADPILRFLHMRSIEASDSVVVEISRNGGPWGKLGAVGEGRNWYNAAATQAWSGASGGWVVTEHLLSGAAGTGLYRLRFRLSSSPSGVLEGFAIDHVALFSDITDLAATAIAVNPGGCGVTDETPVRATVENHGTEHVSGATLTLRLDGAVVATENLPTITAGMSLDYDFDATVDLTGRGVLRVEVDAAADQFPDNDFVQVDTEDLPNFLGLPYSEGFEESGGGWQAYGSASSWARGVPTDAPDFAFGGSYVWATSPSGSYNNNEDSFLESSCMDFSSLEADPWLQFGLFYETENGYDDAWLEMSTNGGTSWTKVQSSTGGLNWYNDTSEDVWTDDSDEWLLARVQLAGAGGHGDVRLRFAFSSDGSITNSGIAIDDLHISAQGLQDIALRSLDVSQSACSPTAAEVVSIQLSNEGVATVASVPVELRVDDVVVATEGVASVAPGATVSHTFAQTVDLSDTGDHTVSAVVVWPEDEVADNDALSTMVTNLGAAATLLPYAQSFESGAGGWVTYGVENSWELGVPADSRLNAASDGTQAWKTNLDGDYNDDELSYVESPCFDFSAETLDPRLSIDLNYAMEKGSGDSGTQYDEAWLELSTDNGETWTQVQDTESTAFNWYTDEDGWGGISDGWETTEVTLDGIAGEPTVRLRVAFSSDFINNIGTVFEGIAFDQVRLEPDTSEDLSVLSVIIDDTGCGLDLEPVTAKVSNTGAGSGTGAMLSLVVDDVEIAEEPLPALAPGETVLHTFAALADLHAVGSHEVVVTVEVAADRDPANDSRLRTVQTAPSISTFPYTESFEADDGDWDAYGAFNSWQDGVPVDDVINTASDGTRVWTTDRDGDYRNSERSFLELPCLDLSEVASAPVIAFDHNFETEPCCDRGFLEYSLDGGRGWVRLPGTAFIANGYSDAPNQWWEGSSGGWRRVEATLDGFQGLRDVRIRFGMEADDSVTADGFAIDGVSIGVP